VNWNIVFALAALVAVATFGRDLLRGALEARRKVVKAESESLMQPIRAHALVLEDSAQAVALQSALMVQLRADLTNETKRRVAAEAQRDALQERLEAADERERDLLVKLGQAWAGRSGSATMPPTKGG
jgi:hypothetical protein